MLRRLSSLLGLCEGQMQIVINIDHSLAVKLLAGQGVYIGLWLFCFGIINLVTKAKWKWFEKLMSDCKCGKTYVFNPEKWVGMVCFALLPFTMIYLFEIAMRLILHKRRCLPGLINSV